MKLLRQPRSQPLKLVIVGNGVAGIRCAMVARQRDQAASITVISGETDYFFSRTALMYAFMDRLSRRELEPYERKMYRQQRIELVRAWVVDLDAEQHTVTLDSRRSIPYDKLVLAVGARPIMLPWEGAGRVREGLVHFVSMHDLDHCERLVRSSREGIVGGGGLIGIELLECLHFHGLKVTFLIREPYYWPMSIGREEADLVTEHLRHHGIEVLYDEQIARIEVDGSGHVSGVLTDKGRLVPCQMLGITVGVRPNIDLRFAPARFR